MSSFPSGLGGKPTLECGHLPLKFRTGNSHQAFKRGGGMNTPMAENAAAAKSFAAKERAMEFALGVPTPDTGGPS
jgi:hypothetical protein